jgi:hypothetical protein
MFTKIYAHKRCGILRQTSISTKRYDEIYVQKHVFDNKKSI